MESTDNTLVLSADNAYNTTLSSPLSPKEPLYTVTSDPGIDRGSTAFTSVTKGSGTSESALARWEWRARWRGDLLTYKGGKGVKATSWTTELGLKWNVNDESGALELFHGTNAPVRSRASIQFLDPAAIDVDEKLRDMVVVSLFLQERTRREKGWAAQSGARDGSVRWFGAMGGFMAGSQLAGSSGGP
ncbi:unnamed protein product [Peniophora sp. CBMAI 1063]|nr:unnamed protein product [Peniophora sp. CBMAI 1063]